MEGIVAKQWGKEDELKQLKSDLAALDRKITAELKPSDAEEAARAKVVSPTKGNGEPLDEPAPSQSNGEKKSMVAEPKPHYDHDQRQQSYPQPGRFVASANAINHSTGFRTGPKF